MWYSGFQLCLNLLCCMCTQIIFIEFVWSTCQQKCAILDCVCRTDVKTTKIHWIVIVAVHTSLFCSGESNWFNSHSFCQVVLLCKSDLQWTNFACCSMSMSYDHWIISVRIVTFPFPINFTVRSDLHRAGLGWPYKTPKFTTRSTQWTWEATCVGLWLSNTLLGM